MAKKGSGNSMGDIKRIEIPFMDGINALVANNISKKEELAHGENVRSVQIGTLEKRQGTRRLGDNRTGTANYALTYFENDLSTSTGFFRISTIDGYTSPYYLNTSAVWTQLDDADTYKMFELGDSSTRIDITNPSGNTFRYWHDGLGTDPNFETHMGVGSIVVLNLPNHTAANSGTFTVTAVGLVTGTPYFEITNASGVAENDWTIGAGSITVTGNKFSSTVAEGNLFFVNGDHDNFYIGPDGTTVTTSATAAGHLYNSPKARKINYYKERLYAADYVIGSTRYKTGIMRSSPPLGIVALVDNDQEAGTDKVDVTDTKYIRTSDSLEAYRGTTKVGSTITVTDKGENDITVSSYSLGDSTTQWDITNVLGSLMGDTGTYLDVTDMTSGVYRFSYDAHGTNPNIGANVSVDDTVTIISNYFAAGNVGSKTVIAVSTNYYEVAKGTCVQEDDIPVGEFGGLLVNAGTDFRYTWDATGADPEIADNVSVGTTIVIDGDNFSAPNNGTFVVTAVGANYFDVTNSLGVVESNKTTGATGSLQVGILESSDELWVTGTYDGDKQFRWADNPATGIDVKQYDTFKLTGGGDDRIRMMTNIGDLMLIANKNNMAVWNDYELKSFDTGIGCVSDEGFVKAVGTLFFVHYTGIYATSGGPPKLISSKIEPYILGATKSGLESAAMGRKGQSIFSAIGAVTLYKPDGSIDQTLSDVVIEYNLRQENWFVHTDIKAEIFATYPSESDPDRLQFASSETDYPIFELFKGPTDDYVTTDKEIPMRMDTGNITLSKSFEKFCYPTDVIIEAERGSSLKCFVSLDNDKWHEVEGEARKGCTILRINGANHDNLETLMRCRRINISIRDMTRQTPKVSRIAVRYIETNEEENKTD